MDAQERALDPGAQRDHAPARREGTRREAQVEVPAGRGARCRARGELRVVPLLCPTGEPELGSLFPREEPGDERPVVEGVRHQLRGRRQSEQRLVLLPRRRSGRIRRARQDERAAREQQLPARRVHA